MIDPWQITYIGLLVAAPGVCISIGHMAKCRFSPPASPLSKARYSLPDTEVPIAEGEVQALLLARCRRCGVGETIWMDTGTYLPERDYLYFFDSSEPRQNLKKHGYHYFEGHLLCPICWQNACEIVLGSEATQGQKG